MPIDYSKYPKDWKTRIRPDILKRANNCCEICGIGNKKAVFRGKWYGKEVFQTIDGDVYSYPDGAYMFTDMYAEIEETTNPFAITIVLTIAHLDHDVNNNDYYNLKALCQRCHNNHDAKYRASNRRYKKEQIKIFD